MRSSKYGVAVLAPVVAASRSVAEVLRRLGLRPTGGNHRYMRARIRQAGLDTSHFGRSIAAARIASIPAGSLASLVRASRSVADVLEKLGLPTAGRSHLRLKARLKELELDTSHFTGCGWSRGQTRATDEVVDRISRSRTRLDDEVFVERSPETNGHRLAKRLLRLGWVYRCVKCELVEWHGQPLTLHLDHINGVHDDNRLENLRFLCPNCHSLTDTYCNRGGGRTAR